MKKYPDPIIEDDSSQQTNHDERFDNYVRAERSIQLVKYALDPHYYEDPNDPYGRNSISAMMSSSAINSSKWPDISINCAKIISTDIKDPILTRFQTIADEMTAEYIKYAVEKQCMQPYSTVVTNNNTINIASLYNVPDESGEKPDPYSLPSIKIKNVEILRDHGWYLFIPCYKDMTIQCNKRRYERIELLDIDESKQTFVVRVSHYTGSRNKWLLLNKITFRFQFKDPDANGDTAMQWAAEDIISTDEFLTRYITDLKWDNRHIHFWFDLFGTNYPDKMMRLQLELSSDDDESDNDRPKYSTATLLNADLFPKIKHLYGQSLCVLKQGKDARAEKDNSLACLMMTNYLKHMSLINHMLTDNDLIPSDKGWTCDDMTITARTKPTIPSEGRTPTPITKQDSAN